MNDDLIVMYVTFYIYEKPFRNYYIFNSLFLKLKISCSFLTVREITDRLLLFFRAN